MKPGRYQVKTPNYVFLLEIDKYDTTYTIQYGDPSTPEGPCMELTYDTNHPSWIKLDNVSFSPRCADNGLVHGSGTKEMIQTALKFCIESFPVIRRVVFNDVASFTCNETGVRILLSCYSLALYGQTWYERHFGAVAKDARLRERLDKYRLRLASKHVSYKVLRDRKGCSAFATIQKEVEHGLGAKLMYSDWYIRSRDVKKYDVTYCVLRLKYGGGFRFRFARDGQGFGVGFRGGGFSELDL